ncbi:hypothetical protein J437_LFUL007092, partial [Ladona fulva]
MEQECCDLSNKEEEEYPTRYAGWRKGGYRPLKKGGEGELYPNTDVSVWLRSCTEEVNHPIKGKTT